MGSNLTFQLKPITIQKTEDALGKQLQIKELWYISQLYHVQLYDILVINTRPQL